MSTFQPGNVTGRVSDGVKHAYSLDPAKWDWADYASRHSTETTELERLSLRGGNPLGKRVHTQLVRRHSSTVVSTPVYRPDIAVMADWARRKNTELVTLLASCLGLKEWN